MESAHVKGGLTKILLHCSKMVILILALAYSTIEWGIVQRWYVEIFIMKGALALYVVHGRVGQVYKNEGMEIKTPISRQIIYRS